MQEQERRARRALKHALLRHFHLNGDAEGMARFLAAKKAAAAAAGTRPADVKECTGLSAHVQHPVPWSCQVQLHARKSQFGVLSLSIHSASIVHPIGHRASQLVKSTLRVTCAAAHDPLLLDGAEDP